MSGAPSEMRAQRHYRDFADALIREGFTIDGARHGGGGHLRVQVRRGERVGTVSLSSPPPEQRQRRADGDAGRPPRHPLTDGPEQTVANLVAAERLLAAGFADEARYLLERLEPARGKDAISHLKIGSTKHAATWLAEALAKARREFAALGPPP